MLVKKSKKFNSNKVSAEKYVDSKACRREV